MAQFALPDSDIATGSWSTTPLWSKVEEGVASADGTTISSDNNTSPDNADVGLSSVTDPEASTGHILRAKWNKSASAGHSINAVLELYQNPASPALKATLSVTNIPETPQTDTYTLSAAEADSITDYADLFLRISRQGDTGGSPGGRRSLVVDAVELEVPDAPAGGITVTPSPSSQRLDTVSPSVVLGSITYTPAQSFQRLDTVSPAVVLGSITVIPNAAGQRLDTISPSVSLGSIAIVPPAASQRLDTVSPAVELGSLIVIPSPSTFVLASVDPTMGGGVLVTPEAAEFVLDSRDYCWIVKDKDMIKWPPEFSSAGADGM